MAGRTEPLQLTIKAFDQATGPIGRVAAALRDLASKAGPPLTALGDRIRPIGGHLKRLGGAAADGAGKLADGLRSAAGAAAGLAGKVALLGVAGAAVLGKLAHDSVQAGDELGKFADRAGLTVDRAAQIRYALQRIGGASAGDVTNGIKTLTKGFGELRANAGGSLSEALDKMPARFRAQVKAAKGVEDVILLVTKALGKIKEPAKQAAFASKFFGDELGTKLGPLLAKEGVAGLAKFSAQFSRVAGPQKDFTERSSAMADALDDAKLALTALRDQAVTAVLPDLTKGVGKATELIVANKDTIVASVKSFADGFKGGLVGLGAAIDGLHPSLKGLGSALGGLLGQNDELSGSVAGGKVNWEQLGRTLGELGGKGLVGATEGLGLMLGLVRDLSGAVKVLKEGFKAFNFILQEFAADVLKVGLSTENNFRRLQLLGRKLGPAVPEHIRKAAGQKTDAQLEAEIEANKVTIAAIESNRAKARREQVKGSLFAEVPKFKDFGPAPRATIGGRPLEPGKLQSQPVDPTPLVSREGDFSRADEASRIREAVTLGPPAAKPIVVSLPEAAGRGRAGKLEVNVSFKDIPQGVQVSTEQSVDDDIAVSVDRGFSSASVL